MLQTHIFFPISTNIKKGNGQRKSAPATSSSSNKLSPSSSQTFTPPLCASKLQTTHLLSSPTNLSSSSLQSLLTPSQPQSKSPLVSLNNPSSSPFLQQSLPSPQLLQKTCPPSPSTIPTSLDPTQFPQQISSPSALPLIALNSQTSPSTSLISASDHADRREFSLETQNTDQKKSTVKQKPQRKSKRVQLHPPSDLQTRGNFKRKRDEFPSPSLLISLPSQEEFEESKRKFDSLSGYVCFLFFLFFSSFSASCFLKIP